MGQPIELSVSQRFEIERFSRAIDGTADAEALRHIAKQLLQAWHTQKAATTWAMGQQMGRAAALPDAIVEPPPAD